ELREAELVGKFPQMRDGEGLRRLAARVDRIGEARADHVDGDDVELVRPRVYVAHPDVGCAAIAVEQHERIGVRLAGDEAARTHAFYVDEPYLHDRLQGGRLELRFQLRELGQDHDPLLHDRLTV